MSRRLPVLLLVAILAAPFGAGAQETAEVPADEDLEEILVLAGPPADAALPREGARSEVTREDLDRRLPRSAPDALRFEPGVFVQQTAHGQGSAYLRGLTGQQTLLLFDGIRLNNSTYRQGPNQYFFTLDSQSIESLQVLRGGSSTRWGSDALGGVILARPIEPRMGEGSPEALVFNPHLRLRAGSADEEVGGRLQADLSYDHRLGFFGGGGGRRVGELEGGGIVYNPSDGGVPRVPRFEDDGRTQRGTGFDEATFDGRLVYRISPQHSVKLAAYGYRQFDAPRTDQCPAAYAPYNECLKYDRQFRTLVYGVYQGQGLGWAAERVRATLSWQQQLEHRTLDRPASFVQNIGNDTVDSLGLTLYGRTRALSVRPWLDLALDYGIDTYHDWVDSAAWISFTDILITERRSRGQYLDGSQYTSGGAFLELAVRLGERLKLRGGGRFSWVVARAPDDPESGSRAVDRTWLPVVGHAGLEWRPWDALSILINYDRSFRAPNLDDLTSRQQTGPGFQFENADLGPERTDSLEVGVRLSAPLFVELWAFRTALHGAMIKSPKQDGDCPLDTPACQASWTKLQLVNAEGESEIWGVEAALLAELPLNLEGRATLAWTWGQGPNLTPRPADPAVPYQEKVPLSRIPPLNGTVELIWRHPSGFTLSADLRWATRQDRLALADLSDERIPKGGTPGFAVFDFRFAYRVADLLTVSLVAENLTDAAYRTHGSSVNGPGRGLVLLLDLGPLWRWGN